MFIEYDLPINTKNKEIIQMYLILKLHSLS